MKVPFKKLMTDLRAGSYAPVYVLMGKESYFIDKVVEFIEHKVLDEAEQAFNQTVLYGKDATAEAVLSVARSYPMMAERRVVIIKEAQSFEQLELLEPYLNKPADSTILVLAHKHGTIDGRKKFGKQLEANPKVQLLLSETPKENDLIDIIALLAGENQLRIHPKAAFMLKELLGEDLTKIANEIEKMAVSIPPGSELHVEEVSRNVGFNKDFNTFELQSALAAKNIVKANQIVLYFAQHEKNHALPMIVAVLYSYFIKLLHANSGILSQAEFFQRYRIFNRAEFTTAMRNYPFEKLVRIIHYLHETDLRSKGVNQTGSDYKGILQELVFKILH